MFINDLHILYYLVFGIVGMLVGQFIDWCNLRMPEYKKIIKRRIKKYSSNWRPNYDRCNRS